MSWSRRRWLVVLVLLCLCLAGAERGGRWLRSRYLLPTRGAQWIWAERAASAAHPVVVWAVRDFDVGESRPARTRLLVAADEEYLAYVNGQLVGAGEYVPQAPLDQLELDRQVQPGWNRIVVELRSARGAGGFLASLFVDRDRDRPASEPIVRSDGSWRIYREQAAGLLEGWLPNDRGEPPAVWGSPPTGRWRAPGEVEDVPALGERLAGVRDAARIVPLHRPCPSPCPPEQDGGVGELPDSAFLVDFGASGVGFIELKMEAAPGYDYEVRLAGSLHDLIGGQATVLRAIPLPDRRRWLASRAARFRYAMVFGVESLLGARTLEVSQDWQDWELARGGEEQGLFGITPRSE